MEAQVSEHTGGCSNIAEISFPSDTGTIKTNRTKERNATICACCVWAIVFLFAYVFFTGYEQIITPENALGYLVMLPIMLILLLVSIYKIGRALLKLYKLK